MLLGYMVSYSSFKAYMAYKQWPDNCVLFVNTKEWK